MLSNNQFDRTRRLALSLAGIELVERHRELLDRRRRRVGGLDDAGWDSLLNAAEASDPAASQRFVGLVTTNFSGFFRHPWHFDIAAEHALWAVQRRGQARTWSAAASTGEEPWSLAMALVEVFRRDDPPVSVLATDIDAEALEVARRAEYGERAVEALEPGRRARFLTRAKAGQKWAIARDMRPLVEFRLVNLARVDWPVTGPFDVIFCRNVLMYLEACHRYAVLERMASLLAPDGLLILDPTEHLGKAAPFFLPGADGVYSPRRGSGRAKSRSSTVKLMNL